jgi:signal transduction histidine kinase
VREAGRRADQPAATVEELLEASWAGRGRPIRGRELRIELGVTAGFLLVVAILLATTSDGPSPHAVVGALVAAYALAARVEFPIGAAYFVPTQLFLVPLFALAPASLVPALVFLAFVLAAAGAAVTRRAALDRVVFSAGDAAHALGPAIVFCLLADGDATRASVAVVVLAFAAQLVADLVSSSLHETITMGARRDVHLGMLTRAWAVDLALGSVGALAAWIAQTEPWAALAPLPLLLLLQGLAADRSHSVASANERLRALEQERGRRQAAAQLLERHTQFLQDVSHELRTPVTIARGHLELLRRDGRAGTESETALDELGRIERMVERLLLIARAEHPGSLVPTRIDVVDFLEDRFVRWSDVVPRSWRLGNLAAGTVAADADALNAALDALIENAVKHTLPAQAITLRCHALDGTLEVQVADEGEGIPPEDLRRIFGRFARADADADAGLGRPSGGAGLGLATVDAVAKAHGGACTVESSSAGSTFSLRLPGFEPAPARAPARPRTG